ncbi:hypothetical protein LWI29_004270 [Acer saccharum]|uniref:Major facilitator superfamily (MFS) profile domain-containing protein n=1 Tax=Acer saccharum TaxID=4024 RepID=A0AA39T2D3_ACESA|nr:hypothetical protein LWI29_004270 [Acer saccharum]
MATKGDIEDVNGSLSEPFVDHRKREAEEHCSSDNGGSMMVYISTFIASCGSFQFGYCVGYSSPAQFSIMKDLGETSSEYSIFGSILTVGAIVGALTCGHTADSAGRKGAMGIASIICILGWIAIYIAPLLVVTGLAVAYAIGAFVSWRTLALTVRTFAGTVSCILLFVGLFFIPESPRWLAMVGRQREFEAALSKLRGPGADISTEQAVIEVLTPLQSYVFGLAGIDNFLDSLAIIRQLPKITIPDLLSGRNIRLISTAVVLMAFQQLVGINGINYYAAEIFKSAGVSPSVGSILYSSTQVVVTAIGATLMDRAGRRPLLMVSIVEPVIDGSKFE